MTQDEMANLLGAYVDEELTPGQRKAFEAHLRQCPECRQQVDEMRDVSRRLQNWPTLERDDEQESLFTQQVMQRLPARDMQAVREVENRPSRSFLFPIGVVLTGAFTESAALVALILSALVAAGIPGEISLRSEQVLTGLVQSPGSLVAQYTWIGQIAYQIMNQAGISGAQASEWGATALSIMLPAAIFIAVAVVIFLAISGWAGWQLSRKRVHA